MFRNRWIRVPLIAAFYWFFVHVLFPRPSESLWETLFWSIAFGFLLEGSSWLWVRIKYGSVGPNAREPRQKRSLMLMQDIGKALDTCKVAIESMPRLKLRDVDPVLKRVMLRSKANWVSWGGRFTIQVYEVAPHLTEVVIEAKPLLPTVLIDSGEAWKTIDQIVAEIKTLDLLPTKEALNDGAEMLQDLTMRPIKVRR
jgi:hypothetical protein